MIQDTTFIIDLLRGDDEAESYLEILEREAQPQRVSAITVLELYEGLHQPPIADAKAQQILWVLDSKSVISADHEIMRKAGKISGELISTGEQIDREDCIIAATALLCDEAVITRNTDHFKRIAGLEVRSY